MDEKPTFDLDAAIARQRAENLRSEEALDARRGDMLAEVKRLTGLLVAADDTLDSLWLFGSLARDNRITELSDIDLAYQSKHPGILQRTVDASPFKVDLVDLDSLRVEIRELVLRHGKRLYGKNA